MRKKMKQEAYDIARCGTGEGDAERNLDRWESWSEELVSERESLDDDERLS